MSNTEDNEEGFIEQAEVPPMKSAIDMTTSQNDPNNINGNDSSEKESNDAKENEDNLDESQVETTSQPLLPETLSDDINEQDKDVNATENVRKKGPSLLGNDFLRSSSEFHDMVVVLPENTLNTSNENIEAFDSLTDGQSTQDTTDNEEVAATKIQASYRGYRARKSLKKMPAEEQINIEEKAEKVKSEETLEGNEEEKNTENRKDTTAEDNVTVNEDSQQNNDEQETAAATKIQASYRGYKTRKELKKNTKKSEEIIPSETDDSTLETNDKDIPQEESEKNNEETILEKDSSGSQVDEPSDEMQNEAATKIQASARGYIERKKIKQAHKAATTIQANYRGYRTRKNLRKPINSDTDATNTTETTP